MAETAALLSDEVFPDVLPLRYLFAAHPHAMGKVLRIIYRAISTHLLHKAGLQLNDGATGAVTLIQRFGSALNLNIHFHILFLDGVYVYRDNRPPRFQRIMERQGLLEQDTESAWLELEPADDTDAMPHLLGSSVSYRIAVGPQQGRKAFMIRTIRPFDRPDPGLERVAKANGFSLHAGVSCEVHRQGALYPEDALPGWNDPGGFRTGGFHRTVGSAGPQAPRQSNPLSWGTRSKSSLARAGYAGKARQRCEAPPQQGSSFTC